jgi:stage V sporulation protein SpoVS
MPQSAEPNSQAGAEELETATDRAIAACGGNARDAVKALLVANKYLESEVQELQVAVSTGYARGYKHGRFKTYTG